MGGPGETEGELMKANIIIDGVQITPNPVEIKKSFTILVETKDVTYVLGGDAYALADGDGALIRTK